MRGHILMRFDGGLYKVIMFIDKTNSYVCKSDSYINAQLINKNDVIAIANPKDFNSYEEIINYFEIINKLQNLNLTIQANLGHPDDLSVIWWGKVLEDAIQVLPSTYLAPN